MGGVRSGRETVIAVSAPTLSQVSETELRRGSWDGSEGAGPGGVGGTGMFTVHSAPETVTF